MSDTLIIAILAVLGSVFAAMIAVIGTLGGVLLGKYWDRREGKERWQREREAQHDQFLRERRSDAYSRFLAAAHNVHVHSPHNPSLVGTDPFPGREQEVLDDVNALSQAYAQVATFGTESAIGPTLTLFEMAVSTADDFPVGGAWARMFTAVRDQFRRDLRVRD